MFQSERLSRLINSILQGITLGYQGVALILLVVVPFLANNWLHTPFMGAFVEQTLVFNGVGAGRQDEAWNLFQEVSLGDQLLQVDGVELHSTEELLSALSAYSPGDAVTLTVQSPEGVRRSIPTTLHDFPATDRWGYLFIPYGVGLVFLAISLWIFSMRRRESSGRSFAMFASSVAIVSVTLFDLYTSHLFPLLWTLALGLAAGGLIDLSMTFPQEMGGIAKRPYLRWLGYVAGLGLTTLAAFKLFDFNDPRAYISRWQLLYGLAGLAMLVFLAIMIQRRVTSKSPIVRQQANNVLWGMVLAFGPLAVFLLLASFISMNFPPVLLAVTIIFPVVTGYGVLRQRLLRTDFLVRQGILYALLSILVLGGYALLVSGLFLIFGPAFQSNNPLFLAALVFLLALVLNPIRTRLQAWIDRVFFRGEQAYEQRLRDFTHALTGTVDIAAIMRTLRQHVTESLLPEVVHIYIYDPANDVYSAAAGEDKRPTSDIRFTTAHALTQMLGRTQLAVVYDPSSIADELRSDQARLDLLGAMLFVPLPGSNRLVGWLALGARRSEENYQSADLTFLDQVCTAAAVAIERAQVIFNLEQRVREMNILARIAQGVNVTVEFDDILELIYAQTDQVMPVDEFHITLYNRLYEYSYFAFCVENDDRVPRKENMPLEASEGLSQEVIRSRRSLMTAEYGQECLRRGLTAHAEGIRAWVGVPLNTGSETIGALSVGSRDATVSYTETHLEILQSIANQAAGAIVKTRLLKETEQRARQLTILNEITRQLTGTLASEPLLEKILQSAVGILNCEAGTLFFVDNQTDELIFQVVNSPVASDLIGKRLAAGTVIVGEAVKNRAPVIANNVQKSNTWYASTDESTGFTPRSILAVPLQVKEQVIGVLEIINRKDGLPFVDDDVNLLSAFAGQAAVAIENSRLYTMTDLELSDRVEELSVMQRIDRELNATLDVGRAMRITLEWALRQSGSEAGLIGVLEEEGMRLTAQQGYDEIEETYKETLIPLEHPAMHLAVESGQPQRMPLDGLHPGLLPGANTQTVIPIRREATVIGLVVMESSMEASGMGQKDLVFLSRLSDHAAIAISNAQLYTEIQRANDAKSEFVSLVAHELKNPMTSIKGYSELLAKGAVGPITDMQGNFLNTIQTNVERMSTLVSDLNDNSKIEAGKLRLDYKAIELAEAVEEVMHSAKRQLDDKKQRIKANVSSKLPKIWADPTRLAQILVNLVSNANKYTPEGGEITVGAEQAKNRWDPEGADEVMHIWVEDNGIGISMDDQQKIFQKFFRSDDLKAREAPGTGLGLNITHSLVEMMGGKIWFESEFRQGTTFHFTIPVAQE